MERWRVRITSRERGGQLDEHCFEREQGGTIDIGRVAKNDVIIPRGNVSKFHARITIRDGAAIVQDQKSTNGCYVNGKRVSAPQRFAPGDKLYVGDYTIQIAAIEAIDAVSAPPAAPPEAREEPDPHDVDFGEVSIEAITRAHAPRGQLAPELIDALFRPALGHPSAAAAEPVIGVQLESSRLAVCSDYFTADPRVFAGGDLGALAVHASANAITAAGAEPRSLVAAFTIEEGFELQELRRHLRSMHAAAAQVGAGFASFDARVVSAGAIDGLALHLTALGTWPAGVRFSAGSVQSDDALIVSGPVGAHGAALLSDRPEHAAASGGAIVLSDVGTIRPIPAVLAGAGVEVHWMGVPAGGLFDELESLARSAKRTIELATAKVPVEAAVRSWCARGAIDPLALPTIGRCLFAVPRAHAGAALLALAQHPLGREAAQIGTISGGAHGLLVR